MANVPENPSLQVEEGPWIEIIQKMESLYANLAQTQIEADKKNEELQRAKTFTDNVIRSMVNSLVVADRDSHLTTANDACCQLLGYAKDELLGKPVVMIFAEGAPNPFRRECELWSRCRSTGSATGVETSLRTKQGEAIPVSLNASVMRDRSGDVIGTVLVATDLREMKRLLLEARAAAAAEREQAAERAKAYRELKAIQTRLIQSEKMSSLGRMAASVAHEINNPLGAIVVYSHLLLENAAEDFPGRPNLEKIIREATRCRDIVRGLLDFARPGAVAHQAADLHAILRATHDLLKGHAAFKEVRVCFDLSSAPLTILCDASQIQQTLTNIMVNAAEAIRGPGAVTVRSWRDDARKMVAVSFADTGCGIPAENVERIFEPFFTTKEEGHGTGLGLAIAYGIVERHGGTIKAESRPSEGTTFTVWLPERGAEETGV
jgi:PAS domain S-box-containing protein